VQLERWLSTIEVRGWVLDIGGSVQTLEGRVKVFNPTEYLIMDNGAEKDLHNKWIEPDIIFDICCPLGKENYPIDEYGLHFDQIFMIEVSEYLINPFQALKNIYNMLNQGGEFYSSWHFLYPQHPPIGLDYLRYTPAGIEKLLTESGFKILENIPRRAEVVDFRKVWSAEKMRGWKDFDNSIVGNLIKAQKL